MFIENLRLINFRRYTASSFKFHLGTNFINGNNGSGKTTILEAIHYLTLTKSFRTNTDTESINTNSQYFQLFGRFNNHKSEQRTINLNFTRQEGKRVFLNQTQVTRYSDIVGLFPVVILSPGLQKITEGGYSERRNWLNKIIAQIHHSYLTDLIEYKQRLAARNASLSQYYDSDVKKYDEYFDAQDEILAKTATRLVNARQDFIIKFNPLWQATFQHIFRVKVAVEILYKPSPCGKPEEYEKNFRKHLRGKFISDLKAGRTGYGPHLDEIVFKFGNGDIRDVGSQGEHKIFLVALKIAEGRNLTQYKSEPAIILLDDLFAFLDRGHCQKIVAELDSENQVLITTTDLKEMQKFGFGRRSSNINVINLSAGEA